VLPVPLLLVLVAALSLPVLVLVLSLLGVPTVPLVLGALPLVPPPQAASDRAIDAST
jgi:hypothetical protein